MTEYKKLVRDKIPDIIKADGKTAVIHIASDAEYGQALADKLEEETAEFRENGNPEELADILEVIDAICVFRGIDKSKIQESKDLKAQQRGTFSEKIILDRIE